MTAPYAGPLTGRMCQCTTCGHTFGGERGFDLHRVGEYAAPGKFADRRRCLSVDELLAAGLTQDARGIWRRALAERFAAAKAKSRASKPLPLPGQGEEGQTPVLVPARQAAA